MDKIIILPVTISTEEAVHELLCLANRKAASAVTALGTAAAGETAAGSSS